MKAIAPLIALLLTLGVLLSACGGDEEPTAPSAKQSAQESEAEQEPPEEEAIDPELAEVCEKAFELIDTEEPGTVPRKRAVTLANEAYFIDDSVSVNEAFSNLNNVYVFDDGTSSEQEVRAQLTQVCG